jgi:hypothetical protein
VKGALEALPILPHLALNEMFHPAGCRHHAGAPGQQVDWLATARASPWLRGGMAVRVSSAYVPSRRQFEFVLLTVSPPTRQCPYLAGPVADGMTRPDQMSTCSYHLVGEHERLSHGCVQGERSPRRSRHGECGIAQRRSDARDA